MTTRRNIIKAGAGLAAILASGKAPAALVRSMLAARHGIGMRVGGAKLPYDAEVEYLESTGTQYIKMGVVLTSSDTVKATAMPANRNSIFGTNIESKHFNLTGSGSTSLLRFGSSAKILKTALNEIHSFECGSIFKIDGVTIGNEIVGEFSSEVECTMFARTNGTQLSDYLIGRIYSLQVFRGGAIVRDFIPVRFTNELGQSEGAMYDRVSGELEPFRNRGKGAFLWGPDASAQNGGGIT